MDVFASIDNMFCHTKAMGPIWECDVKVHDT